MNWLLFQKCIRAIPLHRDISPHLKGLDKTLPSRANPWFSIYEPIFAAQSVSQSREPISGSQFSCFPSENQYRGQIWEPICSTTSGANLEFPIISQSGPLNLGANLWCQIWQPIWGTPLGANLGCPIFEPIWGHTSGSPSMLLHHGANL